MEANGMRIFEGGTGERRGGGGLMGFVQVSFASPILATKNRLQQPLTIQGDQGNFIVISWGLGDSFRSLVQPTLVAPADTFRLMTEGIASCLLHRHKGNRRQKHEMCLLRQASKATTTDIVQHRNTETQFSPIVCAFFLRDPRARQTR